jgi:ER membrane protein complex subunit 1, C-terminal
VTSISLYEGMIGRYGLGPLRKPERHSTFSSFDALPPIALHRTFVLPHAVTGAGLPLTAHGVTAKNVLLALKGGQVSALYHSFTSKVQ